MLRVVKDCMSHTRVKSVTAMSLNFGYMGTPFDYIVKKNLNSVA
jgi:hypothetical protein